MNNTPLRKVHSDGKERLIAGINELADVVASTLGAAGKTVILEDPATNAPYVTKDGVTVAEFVNPIHPVENLGASLVREASKKTAAEAGDGTTTSTVLAQAILAEALPVVTSGNFRKVIDGIETAKDKVLKELTKVSTKVTGDNLKSIASISANNDAVIGSLITKAYDMVGLEGSVLVANSETADTHIVKNEGSVLTSGYMSSHFANQPNGDCVLEDPSVLIIDQKVDVIWKIKEVLESALRGGKSLLIIGDLDLQAVSTLVMNAKQGFKVCVVQPPLHGHLKTAVLEDLGKLTGANVIGEEYGTSLTTAGAKDLGNISKVTINSKETVMVFDKAIEGINELVKDLRKQLKKSDGQDAGLLKYRLNILTGKLCTIKVGAITEVALKELKDRVDDSVHATRCALQEGILPGGGVALRDISTDLCCIGNDYEDILYKALNAPIQTILRNGGYKVEDFGEFKKGEGVDVLSGETAIVKNEGIIDPTKVTKLAVINAVQVACTVLSTDYIITNMRQDEY